MSRVCVKASRTFLFLFDGWGGLRVPGARTSSLSWEWGGWDGKWEREAHLTGIGGEEAGRGGGN